MAPYQERVVEEKEQLETRVKKLLAFMHTDTFNNLPCDERGRLSDQCDAMCAYLEALKARINAFDS